MKKLGHWKGGWMNEWKGRRMGSKAVLRIAYIKKNTRPV